MRLMERYADRYPFDEMVTHEFGLADVDTAMRTSMSPESMKVTMVPALP
jgi:Zn-dependent alcohol dehydrogenase